MVKEMVNGIQRSTRTRVRLAYARRMRGRRLRFYRSFIGSGDLVFDIGANMGERSEIFLALDAVVVAVEPQAECIERLCNKWKDEPRFTLFEGACAEEQGTLELFVSDADTLSSMSVDWIDAVRQSGRFTDRRWDETRVVATTTLDALIAEHGTPVFLKIDVEGFEYRVLSGLTQPVNCASIEWSSESLPVTARCVEHLSRLGMEEFNLSFGDSVSWALPKWVDDREIISFLARPMEKLAWGDLYARRSEPAVIQAEAFERSVDLSGAGRTKRNIPHA
jgi:FkbM family methyltransferase